MIAVEIVGSLLVLAAIACFSHGWYRLGFIANLYAAAVWAIVAVVAGLYGMLALQVAIAILALWGFCKLERKSHDR